MGDIHADIEVKCKKCEKISKVTIYSVPRNPQDYICPDCMGFVMKPRSVGASRLATLPEVCKRAVDAWGETSQMFMLIEEMSELMQAVSKMVRGKYSKENIVEEMADVKIMLEQLKVMCEIEDHEIAAAMIAKKERLEDMLNNTDKEV